MTKSRCLGFSSTISEGGAWLDGNIWQPANCYFEPLDRRHLANFLTRNKVLMWGDSVTGRFAIGMCSAAGLPKSCVDMHKINEKPEFNGFGLRVLFEGEKDTEDSRVLGSVEWALLLERMKTADVVLLNSGLHDLAPYYVDWKWQGDKPHVFRAYRERLETLFQRIAEEPSTHKGLTLRARVIWRTTTFPHVFKKKSGDKWYHRCDTQRLSLGSVLRINAIAVSLARTYNITVWDVSPLALAATPSLAQDSVHPSDVATHMWAIAFVTHALRLQLDPSRSVHPSMLAGKTASQAEDEVDLQEVDSAPEIAPVVLASNNPPDPDGRNHWANGTDPSNGTEIESNGTELSILADTPLDPERRNHWANGTDPSNGTEIESNGTGLGILAREAPVAMKGRPKTKEKSVARRKPPLSTKAQQAKPAAHRRPPPVPATKPHRRGKVSNAHPTGKPKIQKATGAS
jgi:hypothetical protein